MEYIFVADTNLFFECKRLEDLQWDELGVDPICISLTKPVLAEIDKHKKGTGRTKKRAIETFNRVREMLDDEKDELVIRDTTPRVVLRLSPAVKPDQCQAEILDYSINDDRIIGTALAMSNVLPKVSVSLLTDDGGAAATARSVGLPYKLIPQNWKRPPEQTTEAKKIVELEQDLAVYRAQEPTIAIRDLSEVAPAITQRQVASPLSTATVDNLIKRLKAKCPPHDDWSVPEDETKIDGTKITYEPATHEAVRRYLKEERPKWLADCRAVLEGLHEGRIEWEDELILSFGISNVGNRPAINMRVVFDAHGDVLIKRPTQDDDIVQVRNNREPVRPFPSLPKPPKPPEPTRIVVSPPKPSFKLDPSIVPTSQNKALLSSQNLSNFFPGKELGIIGGLHQSAIDRMLGGDSSVGRLMKEREQFLGLASHFAGSADPFLNGREYLSHSITPPYVPRKHDPEAFYAADWDSYAPSKRGAYICDLFRHRGEEEPFDVELIFPDEGQAKGLVICTVHAENLTKPVELRILVSRLIDETDLMGQAEQLVDECD